MLNLNYNIIGSIGPIVERQGAVYTVRQDPFSSSIVLAMPGNLFKDGDYTNQFGMTNSWDDISAYVKAGPNNAPIGTNLQILYSSSLNSSSHSLEIANGFTKFIGNKYNESIYMNGVNSFVVNQTWSSGEGANFDINKNFTLEGYFAFIDSASANLAGNLSPKRILAWKYDPAVPSSSQYIWQTFGGDIDPGIGSNVVSGSISFVYDYTTGIGANEVDVHPTSSFVVTPYAWNHYAVSYTKDSWGDGIPNKQIKLYLNGIKVRQETVIGDNFVQDLTELLQIAGAVDSSFVENGYSGSAFYWQDIKIYNGTDKNYTGSIIPLPESIVVYGG